MSEVWKLRIVGLCILTAFPLFGVGQALLESDLHRLGVFFCISNSAAVILNKVLMRPVIATAAPRSGGIYRAARITEDVLLGISAISVQSSVLGWHSAATSSTNLA